MIVPGMELWEDLGKKNQGMLLQFEDSRSQQGLHPHVLFQAGDIQPLEVRPLEPLLGVAVLVLFCPCGNQPASQ